MLYYLAEKIIQGDPSDPYNSLRYNKVVVNAIGTPVQPSDAIFFKWDAMNRRIAGNLAAYEDNLHTLG